MNGFLLAAIVVVALLVAVFLLRKRISQTQKTTPAEAVDQAGTVAQPIESTPAEDVQPAPDAAKVQAELAETILEEPVVFELEEAAALSNIEDLPLIAEPEEGHATILEEALDELKEAPAAALEDAEPVSGEGEDSPGHDVPQPEPIAEEVLVTSAVEVTPEESLSVDESIVRNERVAPERAEGGVAPAVAPPKVCLTMDAYSIRLNSLEEKQRALLAQAIGRRDDKKRDQLQRELVIMNDKLALLADSYADEMQCYQEVLEALEQFQGDADGAELASAKEHLQAGDPQAAEDFLAWLSDREHPFAARAAFHSGTLAGCRVDLVKALDLYRRAVELEPENIQYLQAAGKTACRLYHYKEALAWLESFVRLSSERSGVEPLDLALAQRELAYTYVLSGQYQKAGPLYKESMTVLAKTLGQDHPEMATSWYQIGELQETLGEYDKAVSLYKKSLEILEKKRGSDHPALANIIDKLAALCMELEMEKQAVPLYERLVKIREKALRPTHPQLALSLNNLAESYRLQGQYAEAEACYQKSLIINETIHGTEHPSVAAILQELAKLCNSQRKPEEAKLYQQRATLLFQKSVDASEKKTGQEALTLEI